MMSVARAPLWRPVWFSAVALLLQRLAHRKSMIILPRRASPCVKISGQRFGLMVEHATDNHPSALTNEQT
jgi:hypothetical protein